jgi:hypothetical protein
MLIAFLKHAFSSPVQRHVEGVRHVQVPIVVREDKGQRGDVGDGNGRSECHVYVDGVRVAGGASVVRGRGELRRGVQHALHRRLSGVRVARLHERQGDGRPLVPPGGPVPHVVAVRKCCAHDCVARVLHGREEVGEVYLPRVPAADRAAAARAAREAQRVFAPRQHRGRARPVRGLRRGARAKVNGVVFVLNLRCVGVAGKR